VIEQFCGLNDSFIFIIFTCVCNPLQKLCGAEVDLAGNFNSFSYLLGRGVSIDDLLLLDILLSELAKQLLCQIHLSTNRMSFDFCLNF